MLCLAKPFKWAETTGLNVKLCVCGNCITKFHFLVDIHIIDGSPRFSKVTNSHFKENLLCEHSSYDKVSIVVQHV